MFFSCQDAAGEMQELAFVRWYCETPATPLYQGHLYLKWQACMPGCQSRNPRYPRYGVVQLASVIRLVYIQPDFGQEGEERFFFNKYVRCEP